MKITRIFNLSLIYLLICATSCEKRSYQYEQGFEELSLNTELASITVIDNLCYVGGENGDLYILRDGKVEQHIQSEEPRIYSVYGDSITCFLGIRNKGVARCYLDKEKRRLRYYDKEDSIPQYKQIPNDNGSQKGNNYSPYAFIKYSDYTVLTTTSNGLFHFNSSQRQDTLDFVQNSNRAGDPFVYCSPICFRGRMYVASDSGFVKMDLNAGEPVIQHQVFLKGKHIAKLEIDEEEHMLYALAKFGECDSLYKINLDEDTKVDSCKLPFVSINMVYAKGKFYFVSLSSLYVTREELFSSTREDKFSEIKLPHLVPSDTRNVITYDKKFQKIRLITNRSVLSFPAINAIGESEPIVQSCKDQDTEKLYFLNTDNELFEYGGDNYKEAKKILQLPENEKVSFLQVHNGAFYYIANDKELKKIKNKGISFIWNNHFWCFPSTICTLGKTTAMIVDGDTVWAGLRRDELKKIDLRTGKAINLDESTVKPYITRFKNTPKGVVGITLNDGLIDTKTISPYRNNNQKFLEDYVISKDSAYSLLLSNHYLYYQYQDIAIDSINITGFSRVFFYKDNGACVSKNGVQTFSINNKNNSFDKDKGRFYGYYVNPDGCILHKDTLFLATDFGMLKCNLKDYQIESAESLIIPQTEIDWGMIVEIIVSIIVIIFILLGIREFFIKKSISKLTKERDKLLEENRGLQEERNGLMSQVSELKNYLENAQNSLYETLNEKDKVENDKKVLERKVKELEGRVAGLKNNLEIAQNSLYETLNEKDKVENDKKVLERKVKELEGQVAGLEGTEKGLESKIKELERRQLVKNIRNLFRVNDNITDEKLTEVIDTNSSDGIDKLNKKVSDLKKMKDEYEDLAKDNNSKIQELEANEDVFSKLDSFSEKYKNMIEIEKDFARYKIIFEKKKDKDTDLVNMDYMIFNGTTSYDRLKKIFEDIRAEFGWKTLVSQDKIDKLKGKIDKHKNELLEFLKEHIEKQIKIVEEKFSNDESDIKYKVQDYYSKMKEDVESFSNDDVQQLFELIEKINVNDGRLEMANKIGEILDIVNRKKVDKGRLTKAINQFYSPIILFHVDKDIYDKLFEFVKNEKDAPKKIKGRRDYIQQSLVILAVAMAIEDIPKKCTVFFDMNDRNDSSINRAKSFVIKWIKGIKENEINIANNPLSVSAYYLSRLSKNVENQEI